MLGAGKRWEHMKQDKGCCRYGDVPSTSPRRERTCCPAEGHVVSRQPLPVPAQGLLELPRAPLPKLTPFPGQPASSGYVRADTRAWPFQPTSRMLVGDACFAELAARVEEARLNRCHSLSSVFCPHLLSPLHAALHLCVCFRKIQHATR